MAKISVIMPLFNQAPLVGDAICSILRQSHADLELIVVDDASTDSSFDVASTYAVIDKRVQVHRNERNLGSAATYNRCASHATGSHIFMASGDDAWPVDALEKLLTPGADVVYGIYAFLNMDGSIGNCPYPNVPVFDYEKFKSQCYLAAAAALFKRSVWEAVGGLDESYVCAGDWDLSVRACAGRRVVVIPDVVLHYRVHHAACNRSRIDEQIRSKERKRVANG